jgi:hypothetical protein
VNVWYHIAMINFNDTILELLEKLKPFKDFWIQLRLLAINEPEAFSNLPIKIFLRACFYLYPQSYGPKIEKRIKNNMGYGPRNKKVGDATKDGKNKEIKVSIISETNQSINIRQTRMWEGCDYILCGIDLRDIDKPAIYLFEVPYLNMKEELLLIGVSNSHGTKESNKNNTNVEGSASIKVDETDKHFQRWIQKYKIQSPWENDLK